jgi:NAD(P)H-quinone oxidoreductase subunit 4
LIITPIYMLSMLREMFYGSEGKAVAGQVFLDAKPRELFIAAALMLPIVGIGFYPKLLTQTYDATTVQIAQQARNVLPVVAQERSLSPVSMAPMSRLESVIVK